ncbi:MAG: prolyl oligopeptidase family serine peptidase [Flavobacteriaceae bacterium]|nr:prolyl oligopeptidase family serine peptidase [Flavobacteriaceae bacterium]
MNQIQNSLLLQHIKSCNKHLAIRQKLPPKLALHVFFWLVCYPVFGQVQPKAPVTEADYHLWGTLYFDKISDLGNWVSYRMDYDEHPDTLFVKNASATTTHKFPESTTGTFNKESQFACLVPGKGLELLNMETASRKFIPSVTSFLFTTNGKFLITQNRAASVNWVCIRDTNGKILDSIIGVSSYKLNPAGDTMLCSVTEGNNNSIVQITMRNLIAKKIIVQDNAGTFTNMVWQNNGQSFAFLQHSGDAVSGNERNTVFYYTLKEQKMYHFEPERINNFPDDLRIANGYESRLTISDDGSKIFFGLTKKIPTGEYADNEVQIWNGNDKRLYPQRKEYRDWEIIAKLAAWWPRENRFFQIASDEKPFVVLDGKQEYAITFNPTDRELQYKLYPNTNFLLTELKSGKTRLWLENQSVDMNNLSISPDGKYAAYFTSGNWWIYSFSAGTYTNVTKKMNLALLSEENGEPTSFGVEGWGLDGQTIVLRDQYDLWEITTNGSSCKRITFGMDKGISYRVKRPGIDLSRKSNFDGFTGLAIDVNNLLLEATAKEDNGYFILDRKKGMYPIAWGTGFISNLAKAEGSDVYVYQEEDFDRPPSLKIKNSKNDKANILIHSNYQHKNYLWGKTEAIHYRNSKGIKLNGVLFYPVGYNPEKKYPMVVHIYEKLFDRLHRYFNPSQFNMEGFNITNMTAKGYFVLLPDIEYEMGNPGLSAADCTIAATKEVIRRGLVNSDKIGLTGHSFGGYETNFIITQTDLFAAAVSGAGISDLRSHYLSIGWPLGSAEIWRYESQQLRMNKSLFEDKDGYDRNSPVVYADRVNTPLLLWTGEEDRQIHYYQSIAFYLALQRCNKKEIMLVYPSDRHVIYDRSHQKDLTRRIEEWFDYYLKDKSEAKWIVNGTK